MAPPKNRRPGFSRKAQYGIFAGYLMAVLGAVVGLVLLIISIIDPAGFAVIRTAGAEVTAPISRTIAGAVDGVSDGGSSISAYINAGSKNAALQREVEENRIKLLEARALKQENQRLLKLLGLLEEEATPVAIGRLISSSASSTKRIATLGVGSSDGVEIGQPVRSPEGLIGRILEVGPTTSRTLLVADGDSVTPVKRASDSLPAFATGRGDGTIMVKAINLGVNPFEPGDLFVTSGNGGLYSPNIPVAIILRKSGDGAIARILADPAKADHVLVQPVFQPEILDAANDIQTDQDDNETAP